MDAFDNCRVTQASPSPDQRQSFDCVSALVFAVVGCRLLSAGCRVFAACVVAIRSDRIVARNVLGTVVGHAPRLSGLEQVEPDMDDTVEPSVTAAVKEPRHDRLGPRSAGHCCIPW
jgi:hypothetical protein